MDKNYTEKEYDDYMKNISEYIKKAEIVINDLPKFIEVSKLSFEEWVKWRNGELNESQNNNLCYCGNPVDISNPDCIEFGLCEEHVQDIYLYE